MNERAWVLAAVAAVVVVAGTMLAAAVPMGGASGPAAVHLVEMRNFAYVPARLEVAVGDTVVWVNRDVAPHTATAGGGAGTWDSGAVNANGEWRLVVERAGEHPYVCAYHPAMTGVLVVRADRDETKPGGL